MSRLLSIVPVAIVALLAAGQAAPLSSAQSVTIRGVGPRVVELRLCCSRPVVVTASHSGSSSFAVELLPARGGRGDFLFNAIGAYHGQTASADVKAGLYRVRVKADGAWQLTFDQRVPTARAKVVPGTVTGRGARVVPIRTMRSFRPVVSATHRGRSIFIVQLIRYGKRARVVSVFTEHGVFKGRRTLGQLPAGTYLLVVHADGAWSIRF